MKTILSYAVVAILFFALTSHAYGMGWLGGGGGGGNGSGNAAISGSAKGGNNSSSNSGKGNNVGIGSGNNDGFVLTQVNPGSFASLPEPSTMLLLGSGLIGLLLYGRKKLF